MAASGPTRPPWRRPGGRNSRPRSARNVHGTAADAPGTERLAAYLREAVRRLAAIDGAALLRGHIEFPDPVALARPAPAGAP